MVQRHPFMSLSLRLRTRIRDRDEALAEENPVHGSAESPVVHPDDPGDTHSHASSETPDDVE